MTAESEKETYYFEITDTFSGEANYCWVDRYRIAAHNIEDAISRLNAYTGYDFPEEETYRDRWDSQNSCVCAFNVTEEMLDCSSHFAEFNPNFREI